MTTPPRTPVSRDKLLQRIRKLLALAGSPNAHEAAAAAARAQALIDEHRLHEWLEAAQEQEDDPDPITDAREEPLERSGRLRIWKVLLAVAIADENGCVAYTLKRGADESIVLVGRARDRVVVAELWRWLVQRIEWLSATEGAGESRKWHEAFRIGALDAVSKRLATQHTASAAKLDAAALVVVQPAIAAHRAALANFVSNNLRLGKGRGVRVERSAYAEGKAAAAGIVMPRETKGDDA